MILAVPTWNDRVAPVFDVARRARVFAFETGRLEQRGDTDLPAAGPAEKVAALVEGGVTHLVCGAITRSTESLARARGIEVVAFVAGTVDVVAEAWALGTLARPELRMPGCRCRTALPRRGPRQRGARRSR